MRWDWQIGRARPLRRTGRRAVDFYDIDGLLTTGREPGRHDVLTLPKRRLTPGRRRANR